MIQHDLVISQFAIENDHRNSGFTHFHSMVILTIVFCKRLPGRVITPVFHQSSWMVVLPDLADTACQTCLECGSTVEKNLKQTWKKQRKQHKKKSSTNLRRFQHTVAGSSPVLHGSWVSTTQKWMPSLLVRNPSELSETHRFRTVRCCFFILSTWP